MAVVVTPVADPVTSAVRRPTGGGEYAVLADVDFDNSYPTGGEDVGIADFNLDDHINAIIPVSVGGGRIVEFDSATSKLKLFTALNTEAVNASDQSAITARVLVLGR